MESISDNKNRMAVFFMVYKNKDVNTWIETSDASSLTFETTNPGVPTDIGMIPFNAAKDEHYSVYQDVFSPDEWRVQQKISEEIKRKQKEPDERTVDLLRVGEIQPKTDHKFVSECAFTGDTRCRNGALQEIVATCFQYEVDPVESNTIVFTSLYLFGYGQPGKNV